MFIFTAVSGQIFLPPPHRYDVCYTNFSGKIYIVVFLQIALMSNNKCVRNDA